MKLSGYFLPIFILMLSSVHQASAQETKIRWFGHAAFEITTPRGRLMTRKTQ
ncbi:MAG: hypothetical protein ABR563_11310 [Pyrinomonadaceae bacterium]